MASCFVIKRHVTGSLYSIPVNGKQAVVAFTRKEHANTYKRLMSEMNTKKHTPKIKAEKMSLDLIITTCGVAQLDLVLYDDQTNYSLFPCKTEVSQDIIFDLENKFRYM